MMTPQGKIGNLFLLNFSSQKREKSQKIHLFSHNFMFSDLSTLENIENRHRTCVPEYANEDCLTRLT